MSVTRGSEPESHDSFDFIDAVEVAATASGGSSGSSRCSVASDRSAGISFCVPPPSSPLGVTAKLLQLAKSSAYLQMELQGVIVAASRDSMIGCFGILAEFDSLMELEYSVFRAAVAIRGSCPYLGVSFSIPIGAGR